MIVTETVSVMQQKKVCRCDKCLRRITDDEAGASIVVFNTMDKSKEWKRKQFHMCWECSFNEIYDLEKRRERMQGQGLTQEEQVALLKDLCKEEEVKVKIKRRK